MDVPACAASFLKQTDVPSSGCVGEGYVRSSDIKAMVGRIGFCSGGLWRCPVRHHAPHLIWRPNREVLPGAFGSCLSVPPQAFIVLRSPARCGARVPVDV